MKYTYWVVCFLMLFGLSCMATEITKEQIDKWIEDQPTEIDLQSTEITAQGLYDILRNVKSLKKLNLAGCKTIKWDSTWLDEKSWEMQTALEDLNLQDTEVIAKGLYYIVKNVKSLKKLNLAGCKTIKWDTWLDEDSWEKQTALEDLNLQDTEVTAKGLYDIVKNVKSLKKLNLAGCKTIKWETWLDEKSWEKQTALEDLNLQDTEVTAKGLYYIVENVKSLKKLNLAGCKTIKLDTWLDEDSWKKQKNLLDLSLKDTIIDDIGLNRIIANVPSLQKLTLDGCNKVKFDGLFVLSADTWVKQKNLLDLSLKDTDINDIGLGRIIANVPSLQKLNLDGCKNIDFQSTAILDVDVWKKQKNLTDLSLKNTLINEDGLYRIVSSVPSLQKLDFDDCVNILQKIRADYSNKENLNLNALKNALEEEIKKIENLFPDFSKALSRVVAD